MDKTPAYWEGYNHYWNGIKTCHYVRGTIDYVEWWEGWEAAAKEDEEDGAEDF